MQRAWDRYVENKWLPWTEEYNAWEKVYKVYSPLFAIHQEQLRLGEEYELVLGLGLLTWQTSTGQRVRRHLVVADAIQEFEARLGKFTVRPHTEGAKLRPELDMLDIEDQPARAEETAKASLSAAEDNPWEKACIEGVLQALVHSINSQGEYHDSLEANAARASVKPIVEYAPALILRKRSAKGLTEVLKRIKEQIANGGDIPGEFADLAEMRPNVEREPSDEPKEDSVAFDGEVFFPKPSNDEQRRIVDKIQTSSGVLVQGPPGTGKSHTIANLIAHFLATGKRILVTAKTPRALQVLMGKPGEVENEQDQRDRGLVHKEIRPLCVSLLGSGIDERKSLEFSVAGILRKNEEWNEGRAERERTKLEKRLRELREEKAEVNRRLRDIRESETHTQSIAEGVYQGTAARIAEAVNRHRANYDWFTDSIPADKKCQVSTNDLRSVLAALRHFTPERRQEVSLPWPQELPSTDHFANLVRKEASAAEEEQSAKHGADERHADLLAKQNPSVIEAIRNAFSTLQNARKRLLATPHTWLKDAIHDVLGGNSFLWHELLRVTEEVIASIEKLVTTADEIRIEFPVTTEIRTLYEDACQLKEHMENGGKLGWAIFRPKPVKERLYVIKDVRIGGRPCSTVEHFSSLSDALHVRIECERAWGFWKGRIEKVEGPYALQLTAIKSLRDSLENALALEGLIAICREAMSQCSEMDEPVWADESQVEGVVLSCRLALARIRKRLASEEIQAAQAPISRMAAKGSVHQVTNDILSAIRSRDMDRFALCANTILDLEKQHQLLKGLGDQLAILRDDVPCLVEALEQSCDESYWEERIHRIVDAWHWAQARYWIEDYIRKEDVPALARRAKQIEDEINSIIAKLASLHAWSFCFKRMQEPHRRHMEAWCKHVNSLTTSGKGKRDFRNRRAAQRSLNECKEAVPAWVMPLHRVWDTVDPSPGMFDVIIIDEASQCGFEALPLLYLGTKILIVGDDKQISPGGEFQDTSPINKLLEEFLRDFQFREFFDVNVSLFDHGKLRYGTGKIMLREHFRCMPEIIRYSNDNWYSPPNLIPLRQYGQNRLKPPVEHVFVSGGYREGTNNRAINLPEAEVITAKIAELCNDDRYEGKTMGVIVLQGEAQATLIESQLLECLGTDEIERRRLICGNPYSFQGDERDIMFLSMVAAPDVYGQFKEGPTDEKRYNVAMSRARDQVWLFHSVKQSDLSGAYLRKGLLDFFETKPQQIAGIDRDELERRAAHDNRRVVSPPTPFESWFEVDVALELLRKDFTVLAQHEVAGKRIDLVVEGGQARLAVECDGDNWHGADHYEADMQRQRQLERCGWEFFRVRECAFRADKDASLTRLWQMLEERGIQPHLSTAGIEQYGSLDTIGEKVGPVPDEGEEVSDVNRPHTAGESFRQLEAFGHVSNRSIEDITPSAIQKAIIEVLSKCPNRSCTVQSLPARVLKEVGVLTRGNPRRAFERRVMRSLNVLEEQGRVEKYRATNYRVRLIK